MKITLCSSAQFFDRLPQVKDALEQRGYGILLTSMSPFKEEDAITKQRYDLIRDHFRKIEQSVAIYVYNHEKKGIKGYVGGNTFLEMGLAFHKNLPIFLLNEIPEMAYQDELIAMKPIVVGEDWEKLDEIIKQHYKDSWRTKVF